MKKRFGKTTVIAAICTAMVLAAGCGSSANTTAPEAAYESAAGYMDNAKVALYEEAAMEDAAYSQEGQSASAGTVADTSRKLITTMNISAETDDLPAVISSVEAKVKELGGYVESSNINNNSGYSSRISRSASLTARIPKDKLDLFVGLIEGSTNITNKSVEVEDVTLSYVDIESRKSALKTEEKRLLQILESAETVEDLITVEDKLADVRYELESIESQLRSYDNRIDYSTVYLYIDEVVTFTPVEKESAATRMGKGFMQSVEEVKEGLVDFAVWFVSHIPQILLLLLVALIIILIIKLIDSANRKRRIKKMQKMGAQGAPAGMSPAAFAQQANPQAQGMQPVNRQPANPQTPNSPAPASAQEENKDGDK
ncbi:DUF4349 domain-containing protein [Butyrivibrio sp. FCS014]|uniref:DUF4349 domain-containing protein n=1 Tax=Butyrivibrio sp. FCS014 TaxID=1408304 RepID=UPI000464B55C|nr:DUF4349 domain-containing protein [Butyrivibrio sp. FCS014]